MKTFFAAAIASLALLGAAPAFADDAVSVQPLAAVQARADYATEFANVRFYFGDQRHPSARTIERDAQTSLRTRKLGRSTPESCQWVMLSALIQLRDHAIEMGGNAVVNIRSNWRNQEFSSSTEYHCAAGFLMAGVALKGDVVTIN